MESELRARRDWIRIEVDGRRHRPPAGPGRTGPPGGRAAPRRACGPTPGGTSETQSQGPVTIKLSMWDYNPQIVRENLDTFEKANPGSRWRGRRRAPAATSTASG